MKISQLSGVLLALLLVIVPLGCRTEGGGPAVALPQLEQLSEPDFNEVCLHTEVYTADAFRILVASGATNIEDVLELANFLQQVVSLEGLLNDPHLITKIIKSDSPKGKAALSAVLLAEDFIRLHWDIGPPGLPISQRTRTLLQSLVEGMKASVLQAVSTPQPQAK